MGKILFIISIWVCLMFVVHLIDTGDLHANPQGVKQAEYIKTKRKMSKVKIATQNGIEFVNTDGLLKSKVITSTKEGANKGKVFISLDYGQKGQLIIGSFASEMDAENIIINDL